MKRLASNLLSIVLGAVVLLFGSGPAGAIPSVRVQPSLSTPVVGSAFDVFVEISSVTDLYAYQFEINFDPAVLAVQSVSEGPFLMGGGSTFFIPGEIDNLAGEIGRTGNMLLTDHGGVNGGGILAIVQFQALAGGVSPIDLSQVVLLDSSLADISFVVEGVSIDAVPEGHTLMFFGSSLIILLGLRAKVGK